MHAYVITTKPIDCGPLQSIKRRLEYLGYHVEVIEGVKGAELAAGEYFRQIQFWRSQTGRVMTPGELGCTLSHHKALSLAAQNGNRFHLILEDDFIASDTALRWIAQACTRLSPGTLLHLGGLEGTPERVYRYVRGDASSAASDVFTVDNRDLGFLKRTVAYAVDSVTAGALAQLIQQTPYVIDDYSYANAAGAVQRVWFRWVVSHPLDVRQSTIETERRTVDSGSKAASWRAKSWLDLSRKRRLQVQLLWRRLTTNPKRFLKGLQPRNQLPS